VTPLRRITMVLAAAWVLGIALAHADTENIAFLVAGTATAHERELAGATFEAVARNAGLSVTKASFTAREASTINACVTVPQAWSCITPTIRDRKLEHVAIISLSPDTAPDSSPMVVITEQIIVARLDAAVVAQRFCIRCTDDVLAATTSELTRSMLQEIAVRSGRTVVTINTTPRGARILFDGRSMGATDRSFNTFPGVHIVVLELDGYRRETRTIEAALDRTSELSIMLRPVAAPPSAAHNSSGATPLPSAAPLAPKLAMGVGALAIVGGAIVLRLDEDPITAPIGDEQPHHYRDTIAPGLGLVIGGAVVCAGGYLWWRYTRSSVTPAVIPLPGGATVGVAAPF
jgi:hypothetical protein